MSITHAMQAVSRSAAELRAALNGETTAPTTSELRDLLDEQPAATVVDTCRHGHPRTPENTYVSPSGRVNCRPCHAEALERYRVRHAR